MGQILISFTSAWGMHAQEEVSDEHLLRNETDYVPWENSHGDCPSVAVLVAFVFFFFSVYPVLSAMLLTSRGMSSTILQGFMM